MENINLDQSQKQLISDNLESQNLSQKINCLEDLEPLFQRLINTANIYVQIYVSKRNSEEYVESFKCEKYHNIQINFKHFDFTKNKLLFEWMLKLENLICLDFYLREIDIQQQDIQDLTQNLMKLKKLNDLTLDLVLNKLSGLSGIYLAEGLSYLTNLQMLNIDLGATSLGDEGVAKLAKELEKITNLNTLRLSIYSNHITNLGASELGISLSKYVNLKTLDLDLSSNKITQSQLDLAQNISLCPKLSNFILTIYGNDFENNYDLRRPLLKSKSLVEFILVQQF
ncbi:hypothetical protein ABPG74_019787 [Tetrahymena malaccensis]